MTVLRNNYSTGPDGTDITNLNSGTGEDDAFDTYNNGPSADTIYQFKSADGLDRPTAEFVAKHESGVSNGAMYGAWTTSMGAQSQIWLRCYGYFSALPDNFNSPFFFNCYNQGLAKFGASIGILSSDGTGKMFTEDPGGTVYVATSMPIIAGAWWRAEARFQHSVTTGNGEVRYYEDADADSDEPTDVISFSNWNLGAATMDMFLFGYYPGQAGLETMYLSGVAISNEDWIGPAPFRPGKGVPGILSTPVAITDDAR